MHGLAVRGVCAAARTVGALPPKLLSSSSFFFVSRFVVAAAAAAGGNRPLVYNVLTIAPPFWLAGWSDDWLTSSVDGVVVSCDQ